MKATDIALHVLNGLCLIVWVVNIKKWVKSGFRFPKIINWCAIGCFFSGMVVLIVLAVAGGLNWKLALICILLPPLVPYLVWFFLLDAPSEEDL
jgi:hypothetical protein